MRNIEQIQWTKGRLESSAFVLFIQYLDYNTSEWKTIKKALSKDNLELKVIKTSKIKKSLEGTPYGSLSKVLSGPMAIIFADDHVPFSSLTNAVKMLEKEDKIQIISGIYKDTPLFPSQINALTSLPSQEELLVEGIGYLQAAAGLNVVQLLDNALSSPVNVLDQTPLRLASLLGQMEVSK